jgi:hypothetical protein
MRLQLNNKVTFSDVFDLGDADFLDIRDSARSPKSGNLVILHANTYEEYATSEIYGNIYILKPDLTLLTEYTRKKSLYTNVWLLNDEGFLCWETFGSKLERWHVSKGFQSVVYEKPLPPTDVGYRRNRILLNESQLLLVDVADSLLLSETIRNTRLSLVPLDGGNIQTHSLESQHSHVEYCANKQVLIFCESKTKDVSFYSSQNLEKLQTFKSDLGEYVGFMFSFNAYLSSDNKYLISHAATHINDDKPAVINIFELGTGNLMYKVELEQTMGIARVDVASDKRHLIVVESQRKSDLQQSDPLDADRAARILLYDCQQSKIVDSEELERQFLSGVFIDKTSGNITICGDDGAYTVKHHTLQAQHLEGSQRVFTASTGKSDTDDAVNETKVGLGKLTT